MDINTIIASVVVSTLISSLVAIHIARRSDKKEREVFLRNKYEEFGELASLHLSEIEKFYNAKWIDAYKFTNSKINNKLITQSTIYFKEFEDATFKFTKKATEYTNKLLELTSKDSGYPISVQIHKNKAIDKAEKRYEDAKNDWRQLYKKHSGKYTNIK